MLKLERGKALKNLSETVEELGRFNKFKDYLDYDPLVDYDLNIDNAMLLIDLLIRVIAEHEERIKDLEEKYEDLESNFEIKAKEMVKEYLDEMIAEGEI